MAAEQAKHLGIEQLYIDCEVASLNIAVKYPDAYNSNPMQVLAATRVADSIGPVVYL